MKSYIVAALGAIIILGSLAYATDTNILTFQFNEQLIPIDQISGLFSQASDRENGSDSQINAAININENHQNREISSNLEEIIKSSTKNQDNINQFDFGSDRSLLMDTDRSFGQVMQNDVSNSASQVDLSGDWINAMREKFDLLIKSENAIDTEYASDNWNIINPVNSPPS
jgi:hypothetical protein